jgi:hypothetical protein
LLAFFAPPVVQYDRLGKRIVMLINPCGDELWRPLIEGLALGVCAVRNFQLDEK